MTSREHRWWAVVAFIAAVVVLQAPGSAQAPQAQAPPLLLCAAWYLEQWPESR